MAIPSDQVDEATRALTAYCNAVPEHARGGIRFGFRAEGSAIRDRNPKWRRYEWLAPKRTFAPLLAEVERDPTFLFWG